MPRRSVPYHCRSDHPASYCGVRRSRPLAGIRALSRGNLSEALWRRRCRRARECPNAGSPAVSRPPSFRAPHHRSPDHSSIPAEATSRSCRTASVCARCVALRFRTSSRQSDRHCPSTRRTDRHESTCEEAASPDGWRQPAVDFPRSLGPYSTLSPGPNSTSTFPIAAKLSIRSR